MSLQHIFQAVLQTSIMAGALVILILLVNLAVGNRLGMRWRYLLWMLVIVRLLLPYSFESRVSLFNLTETIEQEIASEWSKPVFIIRTDPGVISDHTVPENQDTQTDAPEAPKPSQPVEAPKPRGLALLDILAMVWLGGVLLFGSHALYVNIRFWQAIRDAGSMLNMRAYKILDDARKEMKIHTHIPLVESDQVDCSALFGFIRPRLIIPKAIMESLNDEELHYIMLHELAHYKQNDILIGWLTMILRILHWFNPLLWYAFYRIRQDREISCDTIALAHMDRESGIRYGKTLIKLVENYRHTVKLSGMAGIIEGNSPLKQRILAIKTHKPLGVMRSIIATVLFLMIILVSLTNPVQAGDSLNTGLLSSSGTSDTASPSPSASDTMTPTPEALDTTSPSPENTEVASPTPAHTVDQDIEAVTPAPENQNPPVQASPSVSASGSFSGFRDSRMKAAVRQLLNKPEGDLTLSDIESITTFIIVGPHVSTDFGSIIGFADFGYMYSNGTVDNTKGNITDLSDIGKLNNLSVLEVDWQEALDPSTLTFPPRLGQLRLRYDGITDLSFLSGQRGLRLLFLDFNAISDITPLAELTSVDQLSLSANRISDISPLTKLSKLAWLDISKNPINDFAPLSQLKNLKNLYAHNINGFDLSVITGLTNLTDLGLSQCGLKDLEGIQALKNLELLNIENNQISDIRVLAELPNLRILDLTSNPIEDYSVLFDMPSLERVILQESTDAALIQRLKEKGITVLR